MASSDPTTSSRDLVVFGPAPANPFTYATGDTKVLVKYKGKKIEGLVSSASLCQASPVWKNFIYPPWDTAWPQPEVPMIPKTLNFRQESGKALLILLDIVHLNFLRVPNAPSQETLRQVAQLCELYQCVAIVAPWIGKWRNVVLDDSDDADCIGSSWTFGFHDHFCEVVGYLVNHLELANDGEPLAWGYQRVMDTLPPGLFHLVLETRLDAIERILEVSYKQLSLYESRSNILCKASLAHLAADPGSELTLVERREAARCDIISHGSLLEGLQKFSLWPRKKSTEILDCIDNLRFHMRFVDRLDEIVKTCGGRALFSHKSCCCVDDGLGPQPQTGEFIEKTVLPEFIEHMRIQRTKLGT
ncbi:hypothetical protein VTL71DRAFT_13222 [Oculimacula yallundae]|uniref:Uncharacterized protein n=1 Tax=Oculimacula yallundae TaxID=86028 RepID=A0ABR4CJQ7_9HELO